MFDQCYLFGCKVITVFSRPSKGLLHSQNQAKVFVEWWKYLRFYCLLQNFTDNKGFTGKHPWKGLWPQQRDIYNSMYISALRRNTKECHDRLDSKGKNLYVLWAISHPGILEGLAALDFGNVPDVSNQVMGRHIRIPVLDQMSCGTTQLNKCVSSPVLSCIIHVTFIWEVGSSWQSQSCENWSFFELIYHVTTTTWTGWQEFPLK